MIKEDYKPLEIPDNEFNTLHERTLLSPLFRYDLNPSETPAIKELIEESKVDNIMRIFQYLDQKVLAFHCGLKSAVCLGLLDAQNAFICTLKLQSSVNFDSRQKSEFMKIFEMCSFRLRHFDIIKNC